MIVKDVEVVNGRHRSYRGICGVSGVSRYHPYMHIYILRCIHTRNNKKKTQNKQNSRTLQKWSKGQKRGNSIKEDKKSGKKEEKSRNKKQNIKMISPKT